MLESIAVLGMILGLIKGPQQVQPQPYYYSPQQQYYQPQQQQQYYYVPQQQYYPHQSPQTVGSPYGPQGGPQGYYYGQPPTQKTYQTRY
jgi:hypothetical protein